MQIVLLNLVLQIQKAAAQSNIFLESTPLDSVSLTRKVLSQKTPKIKQHRGKTFRVKKAVLHFRPWRKRFTLNFGSFTGEAQSVAKQEISKGGGINC